MRESVRVLCISKTLRIEAEARRNSSPSISLMVLLNQILQFLCLYERIRVLCIPKALLYMQTVISVKNIISEWRWLVFFEFRGTFHYSPLFSHSLLFPILYVEPTVLIDVHIHGWSFIAKKTWIEEYFICVAWMDKSLLFMGTVSRSLIQVRQAFSIHSTFQ
jgi:hypothetical protein